MKMAEEFYEQAMAKEFQMGAATSSYQEHVKKLRADIIELNMELAELKTIKTKHKKANSIQSEDVQVVR